MKWPPGTDETALRRIPKRHLEDACQEAWLAYCKGLNPTEAAKRYAKGEALHERRRAFTNVVGLDGEIDEPAVRDMEDAQRAADRHEQRFAEESGVCPRCGAVLGADKCRCGFE